MTNLPTLIDSDFQVQYIPARIVDGTELYIIYYAFHPIYNELRPKKMRLNHLKKKMSKTALDRYTRKLMNDININLAAGKNPFIGADVTKAYEKLTAAIDIFKIIKEKEMSEDGFRSYKSYCKKLVDWLTQKKLSDIFAIQFSEELAEEFMDMVEMDPKCGTRSYNNHFVFYRSLWYWLIKKKYCKKNVFLNFTKKKEEEKFRQVVELNTHDKVVMWCRENNPRFEVVVDLVRAAFIRPAEICRIQIGDIDLFNHVIKIPAGKSKTDNFRFAYLPEWLCVKMAALYQFDRYPIKFYLVSTRLEPGLFQWNTRKLDKIWDKLRDNMKLEKDQQLYSYRDTGITALENKSIPESVIRKLTDHKSDRMLRRYVRKPSQELINTVVKQITE